MLRSASRRRGLPDAAWYGPESQFTAACADPSGDPPAIMSFHHRGPPWRVVIGELEFDLAARQFVICGDRPALTATEFGLLEILMRRSPGVADRRSIARHVWDSEADAFGSNTIDVHLARLRSKLAGGGVQIETVRGVGYRIVAS